MLAGLFILKGSLFNETQPIWVSQMQYAYAECNFLSLPDRNYRFFQGKQKTETSHVYKRKQLCKIFTLE
jgi:hypothetical protein